MNEEYLQAIQKAQAELETLENRRVALLRFIDNARALCGEEFPELTPPPGYIPEGLTPEIRKILKTSAAHMTPVQIRDALVARNFPHSGSKNLLISVHTVLGRIEDELDVLQRDGKSAYKMKYTFGELAGLMSPTLEGIKNAAKAVAESNTNTFETFAQMQDKVEAKKRQGGLRPPPTAADFTQAAIALDQAKDRKGQK
jgi:hypothetical protein